MRDALAATFGGLALWGDEAAVETAEFAHRGVVIVDQVVHGLLDDAGPFLSVRGLLAYRPTTRWVTVDMGAIRFVHNGADVMAPGITGADPALREGDWCWIRDERNHQPLAVGKCIVPATAMVGAKGKAVASVHYIGDKLWDVDA